MRFTDPKINLHVQFDWLDIPFQQINGIYGKKNPLVPSNEFFRENPHLFALNVMNKPENFYFTCKHLLNIELAPFQCLVLEEMWKRRFPLIVCSRGFSKTFLLAVFSLLRAIFLQGRKVLIVGGGFRQSKNCFEYAAKIWNESPLLQSIIGDTERKPILRATDRYSMTIGKSTITALPLGTGETIRGERANDVIADEFSTIPEEIFETVVAGFGAVSQDPIEKMKEHHRLKKLEQMGKVDELLRLKSLTSVTDNHLVISGTAYYTFNHFCRYWQKYKGYVCSMGDREKIIEAMGTEPDENFNWEDYSVIRIPADLLPPGFHDVGNLARSKATMKVGTYDMEYGAIFSGDSNGFFKRSLIESCVVKEEHPIYFNSCGQALFSARVTGAPTHKYIYGIDPAFSNDNFTIVIVELWPDHRRIVYCWTITKKAHQMRLKKAKGFKIEEDFFQFCARKIRQLMAKFPTDHIGIDTQGGGYSIMEALSDSSRLKEGEVRLWPYIDYSDSKAKDQPGFGMEGRHIIYPIQFGKAEWVSRANHGMVLDMQDKILLFPRIDSVELIQAVKEGHAKNILYDSLEDCIYDIEELKDELCTIVHTQTGNTLRDRWDTPEIKLPGSKKGRLRKDRYSALLIANAIARELQQEEGREVDIEYDAGIVASSDYVGTKRSEERDAMLYQSKNKSLASKMGECPGIVISHK